MMRHFVGSKLRSSGSRSLTAMDKTQEIQHAMSAVTHIMNDDVDTAETELSQGNSSFHKLGLAVVAFIRATLSFEKELMAEATARVGEAEVAAMDQQRKASRDPKAYHSAIYPAGSEYALCHAECQLMQAVVGVLNESLTESLKGFYKLRKAYQTLESIIEAENRHKEANRSSSALGTPTSARSREHSPDEKGAAAKANTKDDEDSDDEFFDANDALDLARTHSYYHGHLERRSTLTQSTYSQGLTSPKKDDASSLSAKMEQASLTSNGTDYEHSTKPTPHHGHSISMSSIASAPNAEPAELDLHHPIDAFTHSGTCMCFGTLLFMLSLIPPVFSRLLSIIGFRGDRERGLKLLWTASEYPNINGAMAGLFILGFLNGVLGFADISPGEDEEGGYPKTRLQILLRDMRARYPRSHLWLLEEARMRSRGKDLQGALSLFDNGGVSDMKQVEALKCFERSLVLMTLHDYVRCTKSWIECVELNNWSHALYYYIAAAAQVELYRTLQEQGDLAADRAKAKAAQYLAEVPHHIGKKKFMNHQTPFDLLISRKLAKWEARAKGKGIDLVDAIGVSPLEELIYQWNQTKRMQPAQLQLSLQRLAYTSNNDASDAASAPDEEMTTSLLRAVVQRNLGDTVEAGRILREEILARPYSDIKGHLNDTWPYPVAHYELAVTLWKERDGTGADAARLRECSALIEKVAAWESYDLDNRFGIKITIARNTLKKLGY